MYVCVNNFNSIKVRLELDKTNDAILKLTYFNSIKVRLELADASTAEKVYDANFNSIKVRLELLRVLRLPKLNEFQFHKGTIRTYRELCFLTEYQNFNSIKVRLEHIP